jgi:mercuric ion transport protein
MHLTEMTMPQEERMSVVRRQQGLLMAAAGMFGPLAASSCCVLPLALFGLGVSGGWIGNFPRLAPHQPHFLAATIGLLSYGCWLVYRSSKLACADGAPCDHPLPNRLVKVALVMATTGYPSAPKG